MYKEVEVQTKKRSTLLRTIILTFSFAAVFTLGLGIGSGRINIGKNINLANNSANKDLPATLDTAGTQALYKALKTSFDGELDAQKLSDGMKKGLVAAAGDPYTEFFNDEEAKEFNDSLQGTFSGIGAELSRKDNVITIIAPIAGFPAEKAGLRPKDVIIKIDGENALDLSVTEAVTKIRGPEGTKVKLTIVRDKKQELEFEITRSKISIPSVEYSVTDGIGYLKITRFGDDTAELSTKAANEFKAKNVKGVIVDMRNNPGGLLESSVDVSSLWLEKGKLILEEKRGGEVVKSFKSNGSNILGGVPTVVLINEGSASASEITAGALRDNDVATLIGVKSFGKGSVQQLVELQAGGVLKVTIARWFTPSGKNIDKEGISPDQEVKRTEEDFKNELDPQKDAAIKFLNK